MADDGVGLGCLRQFLMLAYHAHIIAGYNRQVKEKITQLSYSQEAADNGQV